MIAVGYGTTEDRTISENWWRVYLEFCEVLVDVAPIERQYYVHAESNSRSSMPDEDLMRAGRIILCAVSGFQIAQ